MLSISEAQQSLGYVCLHHRPSGAFIGIFEDITKIDRSRKIEHGVIFQKRQEQHSWIQSYGDTFDAIMLPAIIGAKKYLSLENLPKPFVYIDPRFLFKNIPADKKG